MIANPNSCYSSGLCCSQSSGNLTSLLSWFWSLPFLTTVSFSRLSEILLLLFFFFLSILSVTFLLCYRYYNDYIKRQSKAISSSRQLEAQWDFCNRRYPWSLPCSHDCHFLLDNLWHSLLSGNFYYYTGTYELLNLVPEVCDWKIMPCFNLYSTCRNTLVLRTTWEDTSSTRQMGTKPGLITRGFPLLCIFKSAP